MAGARISDAIKPVLLELNEMGIRYFAGGSVASSSHGIARYTQDVDIVADVQPGQIDELASRLAAEFYADADRMRDAILCGRAFSIIHVASGFKNSGGEPGGYDPEQTPLVPNRRLDIRSPMERRSGHRNVTTTRLGLPAYLGPRPGSNRPCRKIISRSRSGFLISLGVNQ